MRPLHPTARDLLLPRLGRRAAMPAAELAAELGVSVPTVHRLLREVADEVVSAGQARRTRYAARRALRGQVGGLPLYRIDEAGHATVFARLNPVRPEGVLMPMGAGWPVPPEAADGWWPGLPYPLYDMRPQGYMGRQLARAVSADLQVAPDPRAWGDDDILWVLSRTGTDTSGNLLLGDAALERWMHERSRREAPLAPGQTTAAYAELARQAVASGVAGSSAAGEFPKFAARREQPGGATPHVLVKFSGADDSAAVTRWADLLVCEYLALACVADALGLPAARSRILQGQGRTFLEVERFDRVGDDGRRPLVSFESVNGAFIGGDPTDWTRLARQLEKKAWLDAADARRIEVLWWFGRLIANTDMHLGNLSFVPVGGRFALAPAYDMLPMAYAPLPSGELPQRDWVPPVPLPEQREAWQVACEAASGFWQRCGDDGRISDGFRQQCAINADALRKGLPVG